MITGRTDMYFVHVLFTAVIREFDRNASRSNYSDASNKRDASNSRKTS